MSPLPRWRVAAAAAAAAVVLLSGCGGSDTATATTADPSASVTAAAKSGSDTKASKSSKKKQKKQGAAIKTLNKLTVKGRAPMTGYDRDAFGPSWKDVDGNGCDTRNDILKRDLTELKFDSDGCTVLTGVLDPDAYTATRIEFQRGASQIDIDHVVALGNAWVTGAFQWSAGKREAIANDPLNLLAVQASANRQKSDGDAATWLPSNKAFRCDYVARQIAVKAKYDLWVTKPEKQAMRRVLNTCPGEKLPTSDVLVDVPVDKPGSGGGDTTKPVDGVVRYANCTEARAAGVTPIVKKKNPDLYAANTHLDRDKDGVACQ